ncbi:DNA excision repair protein ERCC-1 [Narcine bancroftii]|uniref:DNA excision repair protein ERCC-1 n=1 Tax=Narcine bancroftii TaxID=1343680 RepID=UPI003831B641
MSSPPSPGGIASLPVSNGSQVAVRTVSCRPGREARRQEPCAPLRTPVMSPTSRPTRFCDVTMDREALRHVTQIPRSAAVTESLRRGEEEPRGQGLGTPSDPDAQGTGQVEGERSLERGAATRQGGIIVSPRQRGNPVLRCIRSVPWEFGEVMADFILGSSTGALFLSLRYHALHPDYIHQRLRLLGREHGLRLLLLLVDTKNPHDDLKELARISILADCTLILAWSVEEAGRYLESYKIYENKPVDILKEKVEQDFLSKITDCLTSVKSVNRTDCFTLINTFKTLGSMIEASRDELALCPGLGPQKAQRLHQLFREPFVREREPGTRIGGT